MVSKVIKETFFVLMCAFVMAILADAFFSTSDDGLFNYEHGMNSSGVHTNNTINVEQAKPGAAHDGIGDGAIWYMAYQIQLPISAYYYNYCMLPNYHMTDTIDNEWFLSSRKNIDDHITGKQKNAGTDIMYMNTLDLDPSTGISESTQSEVYSTGWQ